MCFFAGDSLVIPAGVQRFIEGKKLKARTDEVVRMSSYVTVLEHFNDHRNTLKMTTGSANLDSLIDSIQEV